MQILNQYTMSQLVKTMNMNFRIQISQEGVYRNYLIGAGQYHKYIEDPDQVLTRKHFERALNSQTDKTVIKLRRGLTIKFYVK